MSPAAPSRAPHTWVTVLTCFTVPHFVRNSRRSGIMLDSAIFFTLNRCCTMAPAPTSVTVASAPPITVTVLLVSHCSPPSCTLLPSSPTWDTATCLCRSITVFRVPWHRTPSLSANSCTLRFHTCSFSVWHATGVVGAWTRWRRRRGTGIRTVTVAAAAALAVWVISGSHLGYTQADWRPRHRTGAHMPIYHWHYSWNRGNVSLVLMLAQAQVERECRGPWVRTHNYTEVSYLFPLHCTSTLLEAHFSQCDSFLGSVNSITILLVGPHMLGRFWVSCWTNRRTLVLEARSKSLVQSQYYQIDILHKTNTLSLASSGDPIIICVCFLTEQKLTKDL